MEDYYDIFERCYDDKYEKIYGYCLPPQEGDLSAGM